MSTFISYQSGISKTTLQILIKFSWSCFKKTGSASFASSDAKAIQSLQLYQKSKYDLFVELSLDQHLGIFGD